MIVIPPREPSTMLALSLHSFQLTLQFTAIIIAGAGNVMARPVSDTNAQRFAKELPPTAPKRLFSPSLVECRCFNLR